MSGFVLGSVQFLAVCSSFQVGVHYLWQLPEKLGLCEASCAASSVRHMPFSQAGAGHGGGSRSSGSSKSSKSRRRRRLTGFFDTAANSPKPWVIQLALLPPPHLWPTPPPRK